MSKRFKRNIILIILVLSVLYWTAVNFLVSAVLVPSFMEKLDAFERISAQSYAEQVSETELVRNSTAMAVIGEVWGRQPGIERVEILSEDGYRLRGVLLEVKAGLGDEDSSVQTADMDESGEKASHRWAVLLHGYTGSKEMMYGYAYWYSLNGFNVLAPDFRCQGESEGDYIGLGASDSEDLARWIDLILERDPEAEIVLHGLSMGASTALLYAGRENLPDNIKAVISDCAYTDAYSMFQEKIGSWFHLPTFPVVDSAELVIRLRAGYDLKETSPLKAVSISRIPALFIHGEEDRMIPVEMCRKLYGAALSDKQIMIVEGAGHAQAADKDPQRYFDAVKVFLGSQGMEMP